MNWLVGVLCEEVGRMLYISSCCCLLENVLNLSQLYRFSQLETLGILFCSVDEAFNLFIPIVSGFPQLQYRLLKNDKPLTDFSTESFHRIFSTKREDEGMYRCVASNKVGTILGEEFKIVVACEYYPAILNQICCKVFVFV